MNGCRFEVHTDWALGHDQVALTYNPPMRLTEFQRRREFMGEFPTQEQAWTRDSWLRFAGAAQERAWTNYSLSFLPPINKEAEDRAEALLLEHLDDEQKRDWLTHKEFSIKSSKGTLFTLDRMWAYHLGCRGGKYCIQPTKRVPVADAVLARMLLIQADEDRFYEIANRI